ncbi:phage head spike fiber domain-containing protein [Calidithermus chliarophilus]|uniref:phage head spike fiber domain-containing protein n=1 Tax=Calidithermus chliarophilus TaxID=52023 RepID=UPI0012F700D1|nr:Ig-like domain-containing protein [Calidithermus chliarophilus]
MPRMHLYIFVLLFFAGCANPPAPGLADLQLDGARGEVVVQVQGVQSVSEVRFAFNGNPAEVLSLSGSSTRLVLPLGGKACYGGNQLELEVKSRSGNSDVTLRRSYTFDFKPADPAVKLPAKVQATLGKPAVRPVPIESAFSYGCKAQWRLEPAAGSSPVSSAVPGTADLAFPAKNALGDYPYLVVVTLGDWRWEGVVTLQVGAAPPPATLNIALEGIQSAPVTVVRKADAFKVFEGTVQGSKALGGLEAGTYTVIGGKVEGFTEPLPWEGSLNPGDNVTVPLKYTAGTGPVEPGITILAPGDTITEPRFEVRVKLDNPGLYSVMHAIFEDKGILTSWSVNPNQSTYSAQVTLNPDLYNGPHILRIRLVKGGKLVDGPAKQVVMNAPWNGAGELEFLGFPASVTLEPGQSTTLSGTLRSVNGYQGPTFLRVSAPSGISVSLNPTQVDMVAAGEVPLQLAVSVPSSSTGLFVVHLEAKDQWDLQHFYTSLNVNVPGKPSVSLSLPADPVTSRPVPVQAQVTGGGQIAKVEFFVDDSLKATDTASPYEWNWDPGLTSNGKTFTLKAVATTAAGLSGEAQATRRVELPLGVRGTVDLGITPGAGPVTWNGNVYVGGSDGGGNGRVVRVKPQDLSKVSLSFSSEPVRALLLEGGRLYVATNASFYWTDASLGSARHLWTPEGGEFCCLEGGGGVYAAYGSVVRSFAEDWALDVGEPVRALASAGGGALYVATDTRILRRAADGLLEAEPHGWQVGRLEVAFNRLWLLTPGRLLRHPLTLNPLRDPDAFEGTGWEQEGTDVRANVANAPDNRKTADQVLVNGASHFLRQRVPVQPETAYTFSFYARNNGGSAAAYSVHDPIHDAEIVPVTSYIDTLKAEDGAWKRIIVNFTTPAEVTEVVLYPLKDSGEGVNLLLWGARLDRGATPAAYEAVAGHNLCAEPTGMALLNDLWVSDAGGCLTRANSQGAMSQPFKGSKPLAFAPAASGGRLYLAYNDGTLLAVTSAGSVVKQETPVAEAPVLGIAALERLWVPYASGKIRVVDPVP